MRQGADVVVDRWLSDMVDESGAGSPCDGLSDVEIRVFEDFMVARRGMGREDARRRLLRLPEHVQVMHARAAIWDALVAVAADAEGVGRHVLAYACRHVAGRLRCDVIRRAIAWWLLRPEGERVCPMETVREDA